MDELIVCSQRTRNKLTSDRSSNSQSHEVAHEHDAALRNIHTYIYLDTYTHTHTQLAKCSVGFPVPLIREGPEPMGASYLNRWLPQ